jgi:RHS repeat-associated protein
VSPAAFLSSITDRNGNTITLVVTVVPGLAQQFLVTQVIDTVGRALTLSYDSSNRITKITDPIGRTVQYSYNSLGMLATMTDPAGGLTSYGYTNPQNSLSLTQITDPRNVVVMQDTYDANGRVIQQVQADGGIIKFSYTLLNPGLPSPNTSPVLQTVVTDPLGNQTTYRFDPNQFLSAVTDASGQTTIFTLNPSQNSLVSARTGAASCPKCGNPSGGDLSFTYDANGNVLTRTDSLGNATTYTYDPVFNQVTSITDPLLHVYRYTYDSNGNMLSATDPNGNVTSYTYNSFGQLIQTVDALGGKTVRTYDSFGNEATATNALGNTLTYVYDAVSRFIQGVDPLGRTTTLTYDALGRVLSRKDPLGHSIAATYDPIGDVLSMTDESGNEASFTFDAMGRLVSKTDPRGKTDTRTYDLNSNLITFVDRSGQTSTFGYDTLNRLTEERYQDRSTVSRSDTVSRSYDARGRPTSVVDSVGGVFGFAYYADGRPASSSSQFGTTQYARDATGRVTSLEVAGQSAVAYAYDAAGNLLSASQPQASATLAYDARNRLTGITRPNGVSSQYGYDAMRDLLSLTHSGGQGVDLPLTYSYDAVNNRSAYTTNFAQPQAVANSLDPSNRLTASGATSYTYDDNGSMTSSTDSTGATTYTWDSRDRLASISAPGGQKTTFLYDFLGNLIQQADAGPTLNLTQNFVLDDLTNAAVISRSNGDSVMVLAGRSVDQDLAVIHANGQVEYGLSDAINSTQATVDQSGKLVSSFSYEPFGKTTTSSTYPFQFTGRVPVTAGLYYYRARYYCPSAGRFISEDPLGLAGGDTLLYKYGRNNPVNRTDPSGLLSSCAKCGIISVLGAAAGCGLLAASVGLSTGGVGLAALGTGGAGLAGLVCGAISTAIFIALCDSTCNPPPAPPPSCAPQ